MGIESLRCSDERAADSVILIKSLFRLFGAQFAAGVDRGPRRQNCADSERFGASQKGCPQAVGPIRSGRRTATRQLGRGSNPKR
jgi:hypothetical protein